LFGSERESEVQDINDIFNAFTRHLGITFFSFVERMDKRHINSLSNTSDKTVGFDPKQ
jgi:hypothetical protein